MNSTGKPASLTCVMSVGRSASVGCGASGPEEESVRSMPTSRRISVSAPRPICSMVCSTSRVEPSSTTRRSAPAWMTIIETLCATASCSSRAILARSSTTASRAATSRSRSASRARRSRSPTIRRRSSITTTVPSANPIAVLFQWAGSASRPTGDRSVSPTNAAPAANRQREDQTARPYSEQNQAIVQPPAARLCQVRKSSAMRPCAVTPAVAG